MMRTSESGHSHAVTLLPRRPLGKRARPVRDQTDQTHRLYRDLSRAAHFDRGSEERERHGAKYMFELNRRWTIDGSSRWNVARYLNHSCRPNAKPVLRKGRIVFVALRRIAPGEEITYDYGREYFDFFIKPSGCRCAACAAKARRSRRRR